MTFSKIIYALITSFVFVFFFREILVFPKIQENSEIIPCRNLVGTPQVILECLSFFDITRFVHNGSLLNGYLLFVHTQYFISISCLILIKIIKLEAIKLKIGCAKLS